MASPLVGILMGSDSDLPIMAKAAEALEELGVPLELTVISAHRAPEKTAEYGKSAAGRGLKVIIAGAGGAAHLPGVLAALTTLPVVGVPIRSRDSVTGLDSILSIVQMPSGVPVATVGLDGARNAGILAALIIATGDKGLADRVAKFKEGLREKVEKKGEEVSRKGYREYLKGME